MTAAAWLLMAVAVLALPLPGGPTRSAGRRPPRGTPAGVDAAGVDAVVAGELRRRRLLPVAAAAATGATAVASLGPAGGPVLAVVAAPLVWAATGWVLRRPAPRRHDPSVPLVLDLTAAALRSGRPLAHALLLAAPAARPSTAADLRRVAGLLQLGADPPQAWSVVNPDAPLHPLSAVAVRSAESGMKVAAAFERLAADLRAEQAAAAAGRAHQAGVRAMGPLAACFLPSFVCLGVVPVIVGIARTVFDTTAGR